MLDSRFPHASLGKDRPQGAGAGPARGLGAVLEFAFVILWAGAFAGLARAQAPGQEEPKPPRFDAPKTQGAGEAPKSKTPTPKDKDQTTKNVPPQPETATAESDRGNAEGLSLRYYFAEHYAAQADPNHPEWLTEYQIGVRETTRISVEEKTGPRLISEFLRQSIYTERVAKASRTGDLNDCVRRYDQFLLRVMDVPEANLAPHLRGNFQGLLVWLHLRPLQPPFAICLNEGRTLRIFERDTMNTQITLPRLKGIFPATPVRVDDAWAIPLRDSMALLGLIETPYAQGYELQGRLLEVHKDKDGPAYTAKIRVSGTMDLTEGPSAVNSVITFSFVPPAPKRNEDGAQTSAGGERSSPGVVRATGRITDVKLVRVINLPPAKDSDAPPQTLTYELHLARRPIPEGSASIELPAAPPVPSTVNSWVRFEYTEGGFHFLAPQDFIVDQRELAPNFISLVSPQIDNINIRIPNEQETNLWLADPDVHKRLIHRNWEKEKQPVSNVLEGWLPDEEFAPVKRKVYRIEAARPVDPRASNGRRVYLDNYLVILESKRIAEIISATIQDPHVPFRNQVEELIKSFDFDEPKPAPPLGR